MTRPLQAPIAGLLALALAPISAIAQTVYVVDDNGGPGVTHTTISGALAVAGPLDRVDVRPGSYGSFEMVRATRLMGEPGVVVSGRSRVIGTLAGTVALVADMEFASLALGSCGGSVFLDEIRLTDTGDALRISGCTDVRARSIGCSPSDASGPGLISVANSRAQFGDCVFVCAPAPEGTDGQCALSAAGASFVHLTASTVIGGRGGSFTGAAGPGLPGTGGRGIDSDGADIRMVRSTVLGGGGGIDLTGAVGDAQNGPGFQACGGLHDLWDTTLAGGSAPGNGNAPGPPEHLTCGAAYSGSDAVPAFSLTGTTFQPGTAATMILSAGAGEQLTLILGRIPVNVPVAGSRVPRLVLLSRTALLGTVPPSGQLDIPITVPLNAPRGTMMFLQGRRDSSLNGTEMTNAEVIVIR